VQYQKLTADFQNDLAASGLKAAEGALHRRVKANAAAPRRRVTEIADTLDDEPLIFMPDKERRDLRPP